MKKQRKARYCNQISCETFDITDTRYYGVWRKGNGVEAEVKVDPKRFQEATYTTLTPEQLKVINKRNSHYFHPKKKTYISYHCNVFCENIKEIKNKWETHFQPLIQTAIERIEKPSELMPGDCNLYLCGILESDEVGLWCNYNNRVNRNKYIEEYYEVLVSLYSQF